MRQCLSENFSRVSYQLISSQLGVHATEYHVAGSLDSPGVDDLI